MSTHPSYYAELVRRLVTADPPLDEVERQELALHFSICPLCVYQHADLLRAFDPRQASEVMGELEDRLTADLATPYLHDLARAVQAGRALNGFQRFLWQFLCRDREAMGRFCLLEADVCLNDGKW